MGGETFLLARMPQLTFDRSCNRSERWRLSLLSLVSCLVQGVQSLMAARLFHGLCWTIPGPSNWLQSRLELRVPLVRYHCQRSRPQVFPRKRALMIVSPVQQSWSQSVVPDDIRMKLMTSVLTYWPSKMPNYGFILVFWVFFLMFAYLGVLAYGEVEFFVTAIKMLFIVAFFLCAILISSGAIGDQGAVGFKYYHHPGAFTNGVEGVFELFVFAALVSLAAFSVKATLTRSQLYSGTEMIGLTAGESANPGRDVPKAIRMVFWRVCILYLGGIFFLSICIPSNAEGLLKATSKTASSPFVIAFNMAGLSKGGDATNAFIVGPLRCQWLGAHDFQILTIFSAINGGLYVSSRCVTALARTGKAPRVLGYINKRGVPFAALAFCNLFGLLSLLNLSSSAGQVFNWLVTITGVATFITWGW